jgi:hypothetical protein
VAPYFSADPNSQEFADAWIAAIENQDAILTMALELFKENAAVKLEKDYSNAEKFADSVENRNILTDYINDAVRIIQYTQTDLDEGNLTKIQVLLQPDKMSLLHIALFPKLMTNTFIQSLAGILYRIKTKGDAYMKNALNSQKLTELLIEQYNNNVTVMALHLASTAPLDGFFLDQSTTDFKDLLSTFFADVLTYLKPLLEITDVNALFTAKKKDDNCPRNINIYSWAEVTAHALRYYMIQGSLDNIFSLFGKCYGEIKPDVMKYLPDILTRARSDITCDGANIKNIVTSMGAETFQFMLHLRAVLRQTEAEQARASSLGSAALTGP